MEELNLEFKVKSIPLTLGAQFDALGLNFSGNLAFYIFTALHVTFSCSLALVQIGWCCIRQASRNNDYTLGDPCDNLDLGDLPGMTQEVWQSPTLQGSFQLS